MKKTQICAKIIELIKEARIGLPGCMDEEGSLSIVAFLLRELFKIGPEIHSLDFKKCINFYTHPLQK